MSTADGTPPAVLLPADPDFRASRDREARRDRLPYGAIAAAVLAHVVVLGVLLFLLPYLFPVAPLERPPIPVTLVTVPPPPPPQAQPAPPPAPPPPAPPQPQQHELVSGADTTTTSPSPAVDKAAEAAPKPPPPPPAETQAKAAEPQPQPAPPEKSKQEKPKVAKREATPKPSQGAVNRAPGERETEGDPYLNLLFTLIEQHRFYPPNAVGSLGLPLEGTAVYLIRIRADGTLTDIALEHSSGATVLDQTALTMIKQAAPFPPLPKGKFPGPAVVLEVSIHLFPGMG